MTQNQSPPQLRAGVARANITPPIGISMVGFAGRGAAESVHDSLYATALVLEWNSISAAVITLDLIGLGSRFVAAVRATIEAQTGIPGSHVLLCCSHTHYGPTTDAYETGEPHPMVAAYLGNLEYLIAGAVILAKSKLQPVTIGVSRGLTEIGVNRREKRPDGQIILGQNPAGPCDREVIVTRINGEGGAPVAALVNVACHPVSAAHAWREISADFIGAMRCTVEDAIGAPCLFLQGAAGNINPIEMRHSMEPAQRLGAMLGEEVLRLFPSTATAGATGLAAARSTVRLPAMGFQSADEGESAVKQLSEELERLRASGSQEGSMIWTRSRLESAQRKLDALRGGPPLQPIPAEMSALRFGDIALVTAPGEIFCETGMAVKKASPIANTCFVGYTDGTVGYIPTAESYPEGGYEVTHACRVAPDAEQMIRQTALNLLSRVV